MKKMLSLVLALALCLGLAAPTLAAGYTDDQLCTMAGRYFQTQNMRTDPPYVTIEGEENGNVTLCVSEYFNGEQIVPEGQGEYFVQDRYFIDRNSGKGTSMQGDFIDLTPYAGIGYTDDQLCAMAGRYFQTQNMRTDPPYVTIEGEENGNVTLCVSEYFNGEQIVPEGQGEYFVQDRYFIDRSTGKGTSMQGDFIDLTSYTEQPEQTAPALTATPTASTVTVNGVPTAFDAYNIGGANYFKLRDLAYVLNGTEKQFEVGWDAAQNQISLAGGEPYTPVGGEMSAGSGQAQTPVPSTVTLLYSTRIWEPEAYNIGGNNYFKLRDLGRFLDFGVDWDGAANTVIINTSKGYTPE